MKPSLSPLPSHLWGKSLSLDLTDVDLAKITSPEPISTYVAKVIETIDMVAHGPCYIERFGSGSLEGYSAMQFIETSSITIHTDEPGRRVFVDIFSCKNFDTDLATSFSASYFDGYVKAATVLER